MITWTWFFQCNLLNNWNLLHGMIWSAINIVPRVVCNLGEKNFFRKIHKKTEKFGMSVEVT